MSQSLVHYVLLAALVSPALSATTVSLLIDHGYPSTGALNIKSVLSQVSTRKGAPFRFGSTYDTTTPDQSFQTSIFSTFFNHVVAENGCKWQSTEPSRGTSDLTECQAVQSFAAKYSNSFRGHTAFWHLQIPSWLPGSVTATDLVNNVIPQHVQQEIQGMGGSVTSWDVVNEIVGDGVSNEMTAWECVSSKGDWPIKTQDRGSTNLVTDLGFVHTAFSTAYKYAGSDTKLVVNDYNTGGNDAKTACMINVLKDIQSSTSIPYSHLGVGFQSHVSTTGFVAKAALQSTFSTLAALGIEALITEIDIAAATDGSTERLQAAIWGDYLDVCLYSSNCHEFTNWNTRDDESWLGSGKVATLFDGSGNPKPAAYEVAARLQHYAKGHAELCATALGVDVCTVKPDGPPSSEHRREDSDQQPEPGFDTCGTSSAMWYSAVAFHTCQYSNAYYSHRKTDPCYLVYTQSTYCTRHKYSNLVTSRFENLTPDLGAFQ